MNTKITSILTRFVKGILAGGISAMALVPLVLPNTWSGFLPTLETLGISFVFGGLVGFILALQKWASWTE